MLDIILIVIAIATGAPGAKQDEGPRITEAAPASPPAAVSAPLAPSGAQGGEATTFTPLGEAAPSAEAAPAPVAKALPYEAEQQVATGRFLTALEVKPILNATRANWIAVREFNGQDLVYTTHIWSWRCGLVALHIGINGAEPEPWPLPECHEETNAPNAMLPDDGLPYRAFPLKSVETVTVELIYDDLSVDRSTFNRLGALIP